MVSLGVFGCSLMVLDVPLVFCIQHRFWGFLDVFGYFVST